MLQKPLKLFQYIQNVFVVVCSVFCFDFILLQKLNVYSKILAG